MAADHPNQPKGPTGLSSTRTPGTNDEQKTTTPRGSPDPIATPMSGLERVRQRRFEAQRARMGERMSSADPLVDEQPRSAKSSRVSSPYRKVRDMEMGGTGMDGSRLNGNGTGRYATF